MRFPAVTLLTGAAAVGVWFWPGALGVLAYDREAIVVDNAWWRLVTAHWVHFSGSHLLWNLVVLLPAGFLLEQRNRAALRWTIIAAPFAIGTALLMFAPAIHVYAGISGVASGIFVALATDGALHDPARRRWWVALLALFVIKIALDFSSGAPLNPTLAARGIRSVPLAHLVGAAVGAIAACRPRK